MAILSRERLPVQQHTRLSLGVVPLDPHEQWLRQSNIMRPPLQLGAWWLKRMMDVLLASAGLVMLSPMLVAVAVAIKLDSPGPVLVCQNRVGYMGREFLLLKFRSMVVDADKKLADLKNQNETNALMFKMKADPRITRVGRWIRKYSIDEFPQLWNVIKGDMSLVGPRPPLPREVCRYEGRHWVRLLTVPGITGNWQVNGRSSVMDFDRVCALDEAYIRHWSIGFDLKILAKTLPVVLKAQGAA